jgi:long-subunit acyl-CoA synthetase (AMP-forming)
MTSESAFVHKCTSIRAGLVANIFNSAVARRMGRPGCAICSCLDNKIINLVKKKLGLANVRLLISGGAPLASETQVRGLGGVMGNKIVRVCRTLKWENAHVQQEFVQAIFAPVAQGYGSTETAACATVQECFATDGRPADNGGGRVGAIQPANEIKLVSVDEMGYLITDSPPRGEILVVCVRKGANMTDCARAVVVATIMQVR